MRDLGEKPRRAGLRRLSEEEIELWAEVAKTVARRHGAALVTPAKPPAPPPPAAAPATPEPSPAPPAKPRGPPPLAPLERKLKRDLSRGRGAIDGAIDLHGMTQPQAHHALRGFLLRAQGQGARLVIVVTGKGRAATAPSPWFEEQGVLRRLVPHWLRETDLRAVVLGFEEAARAHGGSGALYVRLRRRDRG